MRGERPETEGGATAGEVVVVLKSVLVFPKGASESSTEALDALVPQGEAANGNLFVEFELTGTNCGVLNGSKVKVEAAGTEVVKRRSNTSAVFWPKWAKSQRLVHRKDGVGRRIRQRWSKPARRRDRGRRTVGTGGQSIQTRQMRTQSRRGRRHGEWHGETGNSRWRSVRLGKIVE